MNPAIRFTVSLGAGLLLLSSPLHAQQAVAEKVTALQEDMRTLQRDYIDLQKLLMQSGVSPALQEQLKGLNDFRNRLSDLDRKVAESGTSSAVFQEQLKALQLEFKNRLAEVERKAAEIGSTSSLALQDQLKGVGELKTRLADIEKKVTETGSASTATAQEIKDLKAQVTKLATPPAAAAAKNGPAPAAPSAEALAELSKTSTNQTLAINIVWTLLCGFLVMFMQCGFAMVETGFTRSKNAAHTMAMNFMVYSLGMLGYWVSGFAIQMGGTAASTSVSAVGTLGPEVGQLLNNAISFDLFGKTFQIAGASGFFLPPSMWCGGIFTLFLFQMVFMDTTATIPTGSMAERWRFLPFCIFSFVVGALIYPLYGSWVWGGGWLAALGKNFGLGHGHVDFAGSSVVHLCGGVLAWVGAAKLGPRLGKFNKDGSSNPIPGHNIPMGIIGTFILAFGWFGFNAGSTLAGMDVQIGVIAVNTMLASASGALMGMVTTWVRFSKPDPSFMCNGMLAGMVAITAPCAFVDSWAAVLIGAISGVMVVYAASLVEEKFKLDDPVGAISVHGFNGAWGVLALGLFANGKYGAGWNGVDGGVRGLFYGDASQFFAQIVGTLTCVVSVGFMGYVMFALLDKTFGLRASDKEQMDGMDVSEMAMEAYPPDLDTVQPKTPVS